jgi:hypothetical protein
VRSALSGEGAAWDLQKVVPLISVYEDRFFSPKLAIYLAIATPLQCAAQVCA